MRFTRESRGNIEIIRIAEREATLHSGVESFTDDLRSIIHASDSSIVLDLANVHYIDMAMLVGLMDAVRELRARGRTMAVCDVHTSTLQSTLNLSGIFRHIHSYSDVEEAVVGIRAGSPAAYPASSLLNAAHLERTGLRRES